MAKYGSNTWSDSPKKNRRDTRPDDTNEITRYKQLWTGDDVKRTEEGSKTAWRILDVRKRI
jgi:hypothetical protein